MIFTLLFSTNVFAGENEKAASRSMTSYTETVRFYNVYDNGLILRGEITFTFDYVDGSWSRILSVDDVDAYYIVNVTNNVTITSSYIETTIPYNNRSVAQIELQVNDEFGYVLIEVDEYSEITVWYSESAEYS